MEESWDGIIKVLLEPYIRVAIIVTSLRILLPTSTKLSKDFTKVRMFKCDWNLMSCSSGCAFDMRPQCLTYAWLQGCESSDNNQVYCWKEAKTVVLCMMYMLYSTTKIKHRYLVYFSLGICLGPHWVFMAELCNLIYNRQGFKKLKAAFKTRIQSHSNKQATTPSPIRILRLWNLFEFHLRTKPSLPNDFRKQGCNGSLTFSSKPLSGRLE